MSEKMIIQKSTLDAIGNAIREKTGKTDLIPVLQLAEEISAIVSGSVDSSSGDIDSGTITSADHLGSPVTIQHSLGHTPAWFIIYTNDVGNHRATLPIALMCFYNTYNVACLWNEQDSIVWYENFNYADYFGYEVTMDSYEITLVDTDGGACAFHDGTFYWFCGGEHLDLTDGFIGDGTGDT